MTSLDVQRTSTSLIRQVPAMQADELQPVLVPPGVDRRQISWIWLLPGVVMATIGLVAIAWLYASLHAAELSRMDLWSCGVFVDIKKAAMNFIVPAGVIAIGSLYAWVAGCFWCCSVMIVAIVRADFRAGIVTTSALPLAVLEGILALELLFILGGI